MSLLPKVSRCTLDWYMFKETEPGNHLLVLPPFYARLFAVQLPDVMKSASSRFVVTTSGKNERVFFRRLSDLQIKKITQFVEFYEQRVVLGCNRHISPHFEDEVDFCVALDFVRAEPSAASRTEIGELEYQAKYHQDQESRNALVGLLAEAIRHMPSTVFPKPRRVTFVPPGPEKKFYLPSRLAKNVAEKVNDSFWGLDDPLLRARITGSKASAKDMTVEQKIKQWKRIIASDGIELSDSVEGQSVCIVDDLYQSGATLWSFAK